MLPKKRRATAREVREALARGRAARVGPFVGKVWDGGGALKIAVIVSKKVAKSAVARNRLRRAAYRALSSLALPRSGTLVVFVRSVQS